MSEIDNILEQYHPCENCGTRFYDPKDEYKLCRDCRTNTVEMLTKAIAATKAKREEYALINRERALQSRREYEESLRLKEEDFE